MFGSIYFNKCTLVLYTAMGEQQFSDVIMCDHICKFISDYVTIPGRCIENVPHARNYINATQCKLNYVENSLVHDY